MPGKRHMRYDRCRKCGGCAAGYKRCRHAHLFCWCVSWVPLVRVPEVRGEE